MLDVQAGFCAIHAASLTGNVQMLRLLIRNQADLNVQDQVPLCSQIAFCCWLTPDVSCSTAIRR